MVQDLCAGKEFVEMCHEPGAKRATGDANLPHVSARPRVRALKLGDELREPKWHAREDGHACADDRANSLHRERRADRAHVGSCAAARKQLSD